jgi:hypothetical protein
MVAPPPGHAETLQAGWDNGSVTETSEPIQGYQWAIHSDPDFLVVQLPPLAVVANGLAHDAMKALFKHRGLRGVSSLDELKPPVANGVALTRVDEDNAELVVRVGDAVGVSRIPIPHRDQDWASRVFTAGEIPLLITEAAIANDGSTTDDRLRRDVEAGGVLAAVVPAGDLR